jgi:phosphatidylserine/phosphatidylglycerophosphate/cardiolipin synthase-like enzyme
MDARHSRVDHFPWRTGNRFTLLIDGTQFLRAMLEAIARATHSVWLEIYLFESGAVADRFIDALAAAARRGVEVRALLDDFGARRLSGHDRARLRTVGVAVVFFNPIRYRRLTENLARDHRKLLLVDGCVAFTGGAGITDEFDPPRHPERRWRETMVRVEGPVVADWVDLFHREWSGHAATPSPGAVAAVPPALGDGVVGRLSIARGMAVQEIKRALLKRIRRAQDLVWVATAYFIPSWRVRRALRKAARRGVDVRLLLPGPHTDHPAVRHAGRRFYARLLANGVRIFEYQPRVLHSKVFLCDDWVSIGSSNLDRWNLRWNLEASQEIVDAGMATQVRAMFEADFADSIECRDADWRARPWRLRARERLWGRVDLWLHRLGRGLRR